MGIHLLLQITDSIPSVIPHHNDFPRSMRPPSVIPSTRNNHRIESSPFTIAAQEATVRPARTGACLSDVAPGRRFPPDRFRC
jgi:hypothetical protein